MSRPSIQWGLWRRARNGRVPLVGVLTALLVIGSGLLSSPARADNSVGIGLTDGRFDSATVPFDATTATDSQPDVATNIQRNWLFEACSNGTVGSASISATSTRTFSSYTPPFTAGPASIPPGSGAGTPQCVRTTQAEEQAYATDTQAPGFSSNRTVSPLVVPGGGVTTTQTMTVSFTVDPNAADGPFVQIGFGLDADAPFASSALWNYISTTTSNHSTPNVIVISGGPAGHLQVAVESPVVGVTYALAFQGAITNPQTSAYAYKPNVSVGGLYEATPTQPIDTSSFTVNDPVLEGTVTLNLDQTYAVSYEAAISYGVDYEWGNAVAVGTSMTLSGSMEGNLQIQPNDWIGGGYQFTTNGTHPAATVTFSSATLTLNISCNSNGTNPSPYTFNLSSGPYSVEQNSSSKYPFSPSDRNGSDQGDPLKWEGTLQAPNLCNGGTMFVNAQSGGATFEAAVQSTDTTDAIAVQFHYIDSKGINCADSSQNPSPGTAQCGASWSATKGVTPGP